ncbi:MAG: sugar ABC transporter ATP-binding protein [Planctomycetota bacterium]
MARLDAPLTGSIAPRLEMTGLCKRFKATVALDHVSLSVQAGKVHALIGENGAGKSTLMKVLSGALRADAGTMKLDGVPFAPQNPLEARRAGVTMIYQELSLCPHLTVEENIMLAVEPVRLGFIERSRVRAVASRALEQMGRPEIRPDMRVADLPVASQQIVEIARALATGCRVLVLDEPTSSLAEEDVKCLFRLIRRLAEQNYAIIYISHFMEEIQEIADAFDLLRDGKTVGSGAIGSVTTEEIVQLMIGRKIDDMYPRSRRKPGEEKPLLEAAGLTGREKPISAGLTVSRGEILGIAGLVGSGRTELLRALFGLDPVRSGRVRIGTFTGPASPRRRWKQGVGFLSEDRKNEGLAVSLTVADNVTLSRLRSFVRPARLARITQDWIVRLDIRCQHPDQRLTELSGGNQQKVALARLLHHDVDLLLLDEPTRGIDVASKAQIYGLINTLAAGTDKAPGKAIIMVSSYMPELLGVCDRIAVMYRGKLGPARPVESWNEHKLMLEAFGQEKSP